MKMTSLDKVTTAEQARQIAIDWQHWQSEQSLSLDQLVEWETYFVGLAIKFDLIGEFKENGIGVVIPTSLEGKEIPNLTIAELQTTVVELCTDNRYGTACDLVSVWLKLRRYKIDAGELTRMLACEVSEVNV